MKSETGQSLLELIITIGIFVIVIGGLSFLILESFVSGRLALEITIANFLAEEGMEATKSIRDNSWNDLVAGNHGLAISRNNWVFQGTQEDINNQLRGGIRIITVENIDSDRKKITSKVNWQFSEGRTEEVKLISYLTNWQKIIAVNCIGTPTPCEDFGEPSLCLGRQGCNWTDAYCGGECIPCDGLGRQQCRQQEGCFWFFGNCWGTCTTCDSYGDPSGCQGQLGCTWYPAICSGTPTPCEIYDIEEECLSQTGCEWIGE